MKAYGKWVRGEEKLRRGAMVGVIAVVGIGLLAGCAHMMMMFHAKAERPPASEFGLGPRVSANGVYEATIEPTEPLKVRRMHTVRLKVGTAEGAAVDGAEIVVDGGMPQHGHGLPTKPRVTRSLGGGVYQVDGVKFNMGGWWELKFRIASAAGTDSVVFNLDL